MQIVGFEQISTKFIEIYILQEFLYLKKKKTVVEIISMAIADSLDVICFDLYQLNIFAEST